MESINCTKCGSTDVYFNSIEGVYICKNCDSKFSNAEFEEEHNTKHLVAIMKKLQQTALEINAFNRINKYDSVDDYIKSCIDAPTITAVYPNPQKEPWAYTNSALSTFLFWFSPVALLIILFFITGCSIDELELLPAFALMYVICLPLSYIIFKLPKKSYKNYLDLIDAYEKDLDAYNKKYPQWEKKKKEEYASVKSPDSQARFSENLKWFEEHKDIIPEMYYSRINDLILILEGRRADTIKEAINLMISDDREEALFNAQVNHMQEQERLMTAQVKAIQATQRAAEQTAKAAQKQADNISQRY